MRIRALGVIVVLAGLVLAACGGGAVAPPRVENGALVPASDLAGGTGSGTSSSQSSVATTGSTAAVGAPATPPKASAVTSVDTLAADSALTGRDLILHASVGVQVTDVDAAVTAAHRITAAAGGLITAEQLNTDPSHHASDTASMTIRVPASAYEATLTRLDALGMRISATRTVDDVTDQVVDTGSRITTAQAGITRIRTLLNRANSLGQVIDLESELTRRQSDLESLQRRLASLNKQVALATIDLELSTSGKNLGAARTKHHYTGFVGGLRRGWDAFTTTGSALLTAVGAALPFVALLVVLGAAAFAIRRRRVAPSADPG